MHELIRGLFLRKLGNPILAELSDSAVLEYKDRLAFTTDSFVVNPLFFPGGDIGKLAVCGTVNDLLMQGAQPEYLSVSFILEEGLDISVLEKIVDSLADTAKKAGVCVVTGDSKVVEKGACDKIFINTSGVGKLLGAKTLSVKNIEAGDSVICSGTIAQHGLAVLSKRKDLQLGFSIKSDCAALGDLLIPVLRSTGGIKFMRDPTRGGVATTLNEAAESTGLGIIIDEKDIPITRKVRAACELLGIDPLYIASEGRAVIVAKKNYAARIVQLLRKHPLGRNARIIGTVAKEPRGKLVLNTVVGTQRIVDMLTSEPLPRIC